MIRRLVLAAIAVCTPLLSPAMAGLGHASPLPLCETVAKATPAAVLPFTPTSGQQIKGIFCYTVEPTSAGFTVSYEARIVGLRTTAELTVTAVLHPTLRRLDLRAMLQQPDFLTIALAGCGCISFAMGPHPPVNPLQGTQETILSNPTTGQADVSKTMILQPGS